jgi:hypothetical protein
MRGMSHPSDAKRSLYRGCWCNFIPKPPGDKAFRRASPFSDALFVALAQDLGLRGVTADEPLYNAVHADFPQIILLRNWGKT